MSEEKKQRVKEYQRNYREAKKHHRCKKPINRNKGAFQNCYHKDIFISVSINSVKDKTIR